MLTDLANKTLPGKHPPQLNGKTAGLSLLETTHSTGKQSQGAGKGGPLGKLYTCPLHPDSAGAVA